MLAYLIEYVPVDIIIGLGVGLFGGIIAAIFLPIRIYRRPHSAIDIAGFALMLIAVLLPLIFPLTMFLVMILAFFVIWLLIPFLLGFGKPKRVRPVIPMEVEEVVTTVSAEGRAAVLDQMGIIPYL